MFKSSCFKTNRPGHLLKRDSQNSGSRSPSDTLTSALDRTFQTSLSSMFTMLNFVQIRLFFDAHGYQKLKTVTFQNFRRPQGSTKRANSVFATFSPPAGPYKNYKSWFL